MKYAFFGSPEFAAIILGRLIVAGTPPALVICNPDRPFGRKNIVTPPLTKIVAEKYGIAVWQPESLRASDGNVALRLRSGNNSSFDFFVIAAYAHIIPQSVLDLPRLGTIGVHPSLLPKYRGATPIQSTILDGGKETGVTLYLMDKEVDHGKILTTDNLPLTTDVTYAALMQKLAEMSAKLLIATLPKFVDGNIVPQEQDHAAATFTKKFTTEDGFVDLVKDDPVMIDRKVRALNPDPGVYTFVDVKKSKKHENIKSIIHETEKTRMKILETKIVGGKLVLVTVQMDGKKPTAYRSML